MLRTFQMPLVQVTKIGHLMLQLALLFPHLPTASVVFLQNKKPTMQKRN